jgi:gamma-glutamyltranspeptidase/glutathione hydrolase
MTGMKIAMDRSNGRGVRAAIGAVFAAFTACTDLEELDTEGTDIAENEEDEPVFRAYTPPSYPDAVLPDNGVAITLGPSPYFTGLAAASESLAAIEGRKVLANGGDAIDAAVVVASMLNVVEPQSSGIGGGSIWLIYRADQAKTVIIDCRERAPAAATANMFASQSSIDLKSTSGISVGVPGALHCMNEALALKAGGLTLAEALGPAIATAKDGFKISSRLAEDTTSDRLKKESGKSAYDEARKVFRPGGNALKTGAKLTQTALADTLQKVADGGLDAFYECGNPAGIASSIISTQLARRSNYSAGAGRMACSDLAAFKAVTSTPLELDYHGYKIVTTPAPTSGVHLLEMLGMLDRFNIGGSTSYGFGQYYTMNVMQEAMRLAFADRALWLGDPEFVSVPQSGMLATGYLSSRSALITPGKRRSSIAAGDPRPYVQQTEKQPLGQLDKMAEDPAYNSTDTTHFVTSDAAGNIVSVTTTISDLWGTGLMTKGRGFMLNDQLLNFNDKPTARSSPYNPGANDVAPFKRPRTTLAPTLVFLGGKPVATLGSPGGTTIINSVLGFLLNLIDHRMTLQVAVAKPRFSLDSPSSSADTLIESGFSSSVRSSLENLGYDFDSESAIGAVQAAIIYPLKGLNDRKYGTADPRRIGAVQGIQ